MHQQLCNKNEHKYSLTSKAGQEHIRDKFYLLSQLFYLFCTSYSYMNIHSLSHKHTYTSIYIHARPLICDYYLCMNMHQSHRYIFISRTNNQLRWIKTIPKLLLFCLSLQIKRMHLLATSKKPLLAPISLDNRTF